MKDDLRQCQSQGEDHIHGVPAGEGEHDHQHQNGEDQPQPAENQPGHLLGVPPGGDAAHAEGGAVADLKMNLEEELKKY